MESLQFSSPRSPTLSAPTSPRRHIHSSFPYYFYSTPASPSSDSISAFVTLCESRIKPNSDIDNEPAFSFNNHLSFDDDVVAFADDLFRQGQLLPVAPATQSPLKLPPRLQYIANIRKSLRLPRIRKSKFRKDDDPFVAAVEMVTREDAPWCQLPWNRSAAKARFEHGVNRRACESRGRAGIVEYVKSAITKRAGNDQLNKEESAGLILCEDEGQGKLVESATCTSLSRYSKAQGYFKFLACFRFK